MRTPDKKVKKKKAYLKTEEPLAEKDEVKAAEEKLLKKGSVKPGKGR